MLNGSPTSLDNITYIFTRILYFYIFCERYKPVLTTRMNEQHETKESLAIAGRKFDRYISQIAIHYKRCI